MVPPPDNTGDEFPDFEKMSFEEQMAWLESLARRQGVADDELTTAADMDIPVPENVEIDEPGYVPFEGSRSAREMQALANAPAPQPKKPVVPPDDVVEKVAPVVEEPAPLGVEAGDPMHWLDSLAVQPADDDDASGLMADLFELGAAGEPDMVAGMDELEDDELAASFEAVDASSVAATPPVADDDPLGGMDPMLWLESLAARQGANMAELTTSADLQIADVPEDAVVDEPGYVPFEGSRSAREAAAMGAHVEAKADKVEAADIAPVEEVAEEAAPAEEEFELVDIFGDADMGLEVELADELDLADFFGEADEIETVSAAAADQMLGRDESMEWLESLAKRQGARDEELLTAADIDVPEMPADTVIDEPGYVGYSPLSILPPEQSYEAFDDLEEELAGLADFGDEAADGLSWLEDLAAEPDEDVAGFLTFEDDVVAHHAEEDELVAASAAEMSDDPLAGMSDEDIARAQAQGTLTPHQELAWLKRQARALAETREAEELAREQDVAPAEPAVIPDWLETIRQTSEAEMLALADDMLDSGALGGNGLPDWLHEPEEEAAPAEEAGFVEVSLDGDVESLWGEAEVEVEPELSDLDQLIPDSELAAFINGEFAPGEPDTLAEALDEEYERLQRGDDSEPEWYADAVAKIAAETPDFAAPEPEVFAAAAAVEEPVVLAAAEPVEAPGWLDDVVADEEAPEAVADYVADDVDSDMPDWLRAVDSAAESMPAVASSDALPDWLAEEDEHVALQASTDDMPDWLAGLESETVTPEPEPEPVRVPEPKPEPKAVPVVEKPAPVAVVSEPKAPAVPEGEVYERFRERLESNPSDYSVRLALARALRSNRSVDSALDHYEMLIEAAEMLPDVSDDLSTIVEIVPEQPRTQRLLGDAYMRRGMLVEALDAYRSALHHL